MDFFVLSWFCGFSTGTSLGCGISRNIGRLSPGQLRGSSWAEASSQAAVSPEALSSGPVLLQHFPQARGSWSLARPSSPHWGLWDGTGRGGRAPHRPVAPQHLPHWTFLVTKWKEILTGIYCKEPSLW